MSPEKAIMALYCLESNLKIDDITALIAKPKYNTSRLIAKNASKLLIGVKYWIFNK